ncbi:TonB-dependent receptor [Sphingobium sp. EP60837]|uniref:TonB-dependent receptor n=1 Tax=Sphingobium sp. EP60837 TaxID=1855519 RepID=UPI0007DD40C3|nr:TonB-dependent receptor [Sphingobium sp. EP60837]ANI80122.1 hypothetical protein EP837_03740 [Sphingobium sp. EP60837]
MNKSSKIMMCTLSVIAIMASMPAHAEQVESQSAGDAGGVPQDAQQEATNNTGEIIVTAQRRAQNLQDVPISVTAISELRAQQLNIRDVGNLQLVTPGMVFSSGINYASTFIRGIGAPLPNPGIESSVATYIDGSYIEHAFGSVFDILDSSSMQVLKGPQGSLWGRNASGGVILINTADPEFQWGGRAMIEAGNLDHQIAEGVLNIPVSDTVALRVAARYRHDGGYVRNLVDNFKFGARESWTVRGKLRFQPTDDLNAVLQVQYDKAKRTPAAYTNYLPPQYCLACGSSAYSFPLTDPYTTVANTLNNGNGGNDKNVFVNLKVDYDFGQFSLNSTTSYRKLDAFETGDFDLTEVDVLNIANSTKAETWTQDVTLTSDFEGMFNLIGGVNYLNDVTDFALGFPAASQFPNWPQAFNNHITTESISFFGDGSLEPVEGLKVTVGGRYTKDRREMFNQPVKFSRFTKRFVISYDTGPLNVYASYNDGFKAGGVVADKAAPPPSVFLPEKIKGYEVGLKFVSTDKRVRANLALFHYKNRDLQVLAVDQDATGGELGSTLNADAKGKGVEFDAEFSPVDNLQIFTGLSYLKTRYIDFIYNQALLPALDANGQPQVGNEDLSGHPLIRAPKWTYFIGATATGDISEDWKAELTGFVRYTSSFDFAPGAGGPLRFDREPAYTTARASLTIMPQDERYQIGFFVENLTNKVYSDFRFATPPFGSSRIVARPRTFGVRLGTKF